MHEMTFYAENSVSRDSVGGSLKRILDRIRKSKRERVTLKYYIISICSK